MTSKLSFKVPELVLLCRWIASPREFLFALCIDCLSVRFEDNNFNDRGSTDFTEDKSFTYRLPCGYTCTLSGWMYTRTYARGFVRNAAGDGKAVVEGLEPEEVYNYLIYQYASSYAGTNDYSVNGVLMGSTTSKNGGAPTASGTAVADSDGKITFLFTRLAQHVHLSGIRVSPIITRTTFSLC